MNNTLLYFLTCVILGPIWYAISFQKGVVDLEISVGYRFGLAALTLLIWCLVKKRNLWFSFTDHCFFMLQGIVMFSLNSLCIYYATQHLISGALGLIASSIIIYNAILSYLIYRTPLSQNVAIGALLGLGGIGIIFWPQISTLQLNNNTYVGIALALIGALFSSFGNMIALRNQNHRLPVIENNLFSMGYGALLIFVIAIIKGQHFTFDWSFPYVASLLYLSIIGTVGGFYCYFTLLGRIGAVKAAYTRVLTSVVALIISTIFEDFAWPPHVIVGVALALIGNVFILRRQNFKITKQ